MTVIQSPYSYYGRYRKALDKPIIQAPALVGDPVPVETRTYPVAVASAFGRFFYGVGNTVYFSRLLLNKEDAGRCYQTNDPTSDETPDLLDTDGGEITLEDSGDIIALKRFLNGVLAFTSNGIWHIKGGEGGFKTTEYVVVKVAEEPTTSPRSIVAVNERLFYWAASDIFAIAPNEFGELKTASITEQTIKSYYLDIQGKSGVAGNYIFSEERIYWNITSQTEEETFSLVFDLNTNGFYPQLMNGRQDIVFDSTLFSGKVEWLKEDTTEISAGVYDWTGTWSEMANEDFEDHGVAYDAYLLSGYETLQGFSHSKNSPSGMFFFNKTETQITAFDSGTNTYTFDKPSGCLLQVRWDYDSSDAYNKWVGITNLAGGVGTEMQLYQPMQRRFIAPTDTYPVDFDTGEGVISTRRTFRGNGKAIQFYFEAEQGKDMQLLGYNIEYSMRGRQ